MKRKAVDTTALNVLILEDSPQDVERIREQLNNAGYDLTLDRVSTEQKYISLLYKNKYDIILSDFKAPSFDAFQSLHRASEICPDVPFICVSSSIGEETAVGLIRQGAADYVHKDRLGRLPLAVKGALDEAKKKESRRQAEQTLRESVERYKHLTKISPVGIFYTDAKGLTTYVNSRWCQIAGLSFDGALQNGWLSAVHPDDKERIFQEWEEAARLQRASFCDYRFVRPDGTIAWVLGQSIPEKNSENQIIGYIGTITDITERKQMEESVRDSEQRFRMVFENVFDGISIYNEDPDPSQRRLVECNERYAAMAGRSREELLQIGSTFELQKKLEDEEETNRAPFLAGEGFFRGSFSWIRPDRKENIIEYASMPITWKGKSYLIGIDRDVTEHRREEFELLKLNRLYAVLSNINQLIVRERNRQKIFEEVCRIVVEYGKLSMCWIGITDEESGVVKQIAHAGTTDGYLEYLHISLSDDFERGGVTGTALREGRNIVCNDIEHDEKMLPWREKALATGFRSSAAFSLQVSAKTVGAINFYANEINYFDTAEIGLFDELSKDISFALEMLQREEERKRVDEKNSEQARLLDIALDVIIVRDMNDRLLYWNKAAEQTYGWTFAEANSFAVQGVIHEEDLLLYEKDRKEFLEKGFWEGELHQKTKDGRSIITSSRWTLVRDQQGNPSSRLIVTRDITEKKKAEEALRSSHSFNELLLKTIPFGMDIVDEQGTILFMSGVMKNIFGAAGVGQRCWLMYRDDKQQCRDCPLRKGIEIGRVDVFETAGVVGDRIFQISHTGIMYEGKKAMLEVFVEVTEQRKLQYQFLQAQKIQSIGTLAGGIAHDFNNILGIILVYSSILERHAEEKDKVLESGAAITKAVERGAALVRQILTFARKADVSFQPLAVPEFVREMASMLEETFPKMIEVKTEIEKNIPFISADHAQMHQALLNLCVNARDAMPLGGVLNMNAGTVEQKIVKERFPMASGERYVCISVSDTGTGMDAKTKNRIFDPFFTTKEKGKGTGLGLSVVYGVMQAHRGFVDVESKEGKGTTFFLYLPVPHDADLERKEIETDSSEAAGGKETILLTEDEAVLRNFLKGLFESKGYRVYTAADGLEAVEVYKARHGEIDLVLTDVGLPKMNGVDEFKKMREIDPQVKILLASGFIEPETKAELLRSGAKGFIQKPYKPYDVLKEIRKILDQSK